MKLDRTQEVAGCRRAARLRSRCLSGRLVTLPRLARKDEHPKRPEIAGIDEAVALDLPDDSVDAAFANMVLHPRGGPEHADVWLGFSDDRIQEFFAAAGIERPSLESLGKQ